MNALINKMFSKTFLFKMIFISSIFLQTVVLRYRRGLFGASNFITALIELFSNRFFLFELFFISIFILSYDSISEVYLKNEITIKRNRKKILSDKILEFTMKYVLVLGMVFAICLILCMFSDKISFGISWDTAYLENVFGGNLTAQIPAVVVLLEMVLKYYMVALIMFLFGYYIYIITNSPVKGVVSSIAVIISLIMLGEDAKLLMVRGDSVMQMLAKLSLNYNMGLINYYNTTSMNSFLIKESISFMYLLVLVLVLYILSENKIMKKDVL